MEAVDTRTGELRIATSEDLEQARLFGGFDQVEAYEISVTGATGFPGDESLSLGDTVELVIRGRVTKLTQEVRELSEKQGGGEVLVRLATVKAARVEVNR